MSVTIEQLSEYLDFNPEDDLGAVKKQINSKFVTIDSAAENDEVVEKVMGRSNGVIRSQITKIAGIVGVEGFGKKDISEMKTTDVMDAFAEKASEKLSGYETEKAELEKAVKDAQKNGSSAKDVQEWQEKYTQLEQKYTDTTTALDSVKSEYEQHKESVQKEKEKSFYENYKKKSFGALNYNTDDEDKIYGFEQRILKSVKLDREDDKAIIRDPETGKRIPNPEKAGEHLSLDEYAKMKATERGLIGDKPHEGKKVTKLSQPNPVVPTKDKGDEGRGVVRGTRRTA